MAEDFEIAKAVYRVEVAGLKLAEDTLQAFGDKIKELNDRLISLKASLGSSTSFGQAVDIAALVNKIKELEIELEKMTAKEASTRKEVEALTAAQKANASATDSQTKSSNASSNQRDKEAISFKTLEQRIRSVSTARQEANQGLGFANFEGENLSAQKLLDKELELTAELNKHRQIRSDVVGVIDKANIAEEGSLNRLKQERDLLQTILSNKKEGSTAVVDNQVRSYEELVSMLTTVNLDIAEEEGRLNRINGVITEQVSKFDLLVASRKELSNLIKSAELTGQDTVQVGNIRITLQEAKEEVNQIIAKEAQLNSSLSEQQNILKQIVGSKQASILSEDKILSSQKLELLQLESIRNANVNQSDVQFKNQILSYQQLIDKIATLREAEELQRNEQLQLSSGIENTTERIDSLIQRETKLAEAVSIANSSAKLDPFLAQRGGITVNFENQNLSFQQAKELQQQINIEKQTEINELNKLNEQQNLYNSKLEQERQLSIANLTIDENSFSELKRRSDELTKLVNTKTTGGTLISFENQLLTFEQAQQELKGINQELAIAKERADSVKFQEQLSQIDLLKSNIKEFTNLIQSAAVSGSSTVTFQGVTVSIDKARESLRAMSSELSNIERLTDSETGLVNRQNEAEQRSLTTLKQQRLELEEIIRNRAVGSTTVNVGGSTINLSEAIDARNLLKVAEDELTDRIKLRDLAMKASEASIDGLTAKAKLLTETLKSLNGNVTAEQFAEMKSNISSLVVGFDKFTLEEINADKSTELLTQETFKANKAILDFNRSISGRNTLVGDYTKGIVDAFKQTGFADVLQQQRVQLQNDLVQQTIKLSELKTQYRDLGATGGQSYEEIKQKVLDVGKAQASTVAQIKNINVAFRESGTVGGGIANALTTSFDNLGKKILQTAGIYIGFQAAISGISRAINIDKELTDKFSDLQRILGTTKEGVDGIVDSLRKIDTRTPISDLTDMAVVAAKAGVAEKDISGVAEAMNRLKLVVGKDFGGDIEGATETLVKLVNIFIGPGKATAENISRIGNALITLDQEGVATADFIAKFAEEMSGVEGITKIGIPSVLGLGAAFQETGIRAEVSSTAISQILIRIGANIQKYAALANNVRIADVTQSQVEAFRALLRDNPGESLIQLAIGLKKNKENFDEFGAAFADLGAKGFKVTSVFGDLADKADFFRQKIELAKNALGDQNVIMEGAALKEENLAGVLDKIAAKFQLAFSNPQLLQTIKVIGEGVLTLTNALFQIPFQAVLVGVAGISAAYLAYRFNIGGAELAQRLFNKESITSSLISKAQELQIISETEAETLRNRVMAASSIENKNLRASVQATIIQESLAEVSKKKLIIAQELENSTTATSTEKQVANAESKLATALADKSLTLATEGTTIATEELNTATAASPLGLILAILGLLIPLMGTFGAKLDDTTEKIDEQNSKLSVNAELQKLIGENIGKSVTEVQTKAQLLINILKDEKLSLDTRKAAYNELIKLSPEFVGSINNDAKSVADLKLDVNKLNISLQDLISNLNETATTAAFAQLKINAVGALTGIIQKQIETETEQKRLEQDLTTFTTGEIKKRFNALTQEQVQSLKDIRAAQLRSELPGKVQTIEEIFTDQELDRQKEDQAKLLETQGDVNKLKIERTNQEQKTTATLEAVQGQINTLDASLQEKIKTQSDVEKTITSIQKDATTQSKTRLDNLKTAQESVDKISHDILIATGNGDIDRVNSLKEKLVSAQTQVKQYSEITGKEKQLNDLTQQDNTLKQEIVNKNKNISSLTNQQIEDNKKDNEKRKEEVKTKDEAIKLLEDERDRYNALIVGTIKDIESVDKNTSDSRELNSHLGDLIKARNDINKKLKELGVSLSSNEGLSPQESSLLKFLEAEKDLELAEEEDRFAKIKAIRKATLDEETTHNRKMFEITEFWNGKMVESIEGSNNAELLKRAQIGKQTEDLELQTNQRILQDRQNQLDEDSRIERKHLDARKQQLLDEIELVKSVSDITNEEIAVSHKHMDDVLLQETQDSYSTLIIEAQKFGLSTEVLEEERNKRVSEINKDALQANKELYDSYYQDISVTIRKQLSEETESINRLREKILNSNKADFFKDQDLGQLDKLQKLVEAIDKVTEAERKYRSMQLESDIVLRTTTKVTEDYLHSQVSSNLAVEKMSVSFKGSDKIILSTVDDTKKLDTETKNLITTTETLNKATREQSNSQHDALVKAREDVRTATEELLGGVNDLGTIQGLAKEGVESLFKGLFKIDPKDVADAKAKGGQAWEDMQNEIKKKTQGREVLGKVLASAFDTAGLAMQTYFDNELNNINRNKQALEDRIDVETAQLKARAQSQAESDAIDREAAAKKKAVERDAANQEKKVKIQELKMALALEIANIAASAAKLLFPLNLIEFAALSGLAYARYALNVSQVNSATFAKGIRLTLDNVDNFATGGRINKLFSKGGKLLRKWFVNDTFETSKSNLSTPTVSSYAFGGKQDMETVWGGKVNGRSHADGGNKFLFKGRVFEDEVDELNIIRTKNAPKGKKYSISGTQEQIASALNVIGGGITFNGGADIKHLQFGGILSDNLNRTSPAFALQAPNPQSIIRANQSNNNLENAIEDLTKNVKEVSKKVDQTTQNLNFVFAQTNKRIDNIKVQVVSKEVRKSDNDAKKASSIGRL